MNRDDHAMGLGRLIGNIQTLEIVIRLFLCEMAKQTVEFPDHNMVEMKETYLTNYMSLGELIKDYNGCLSASEAAFLCDPLVVTIRDAIAHGRLMSTSQDFPLTLYKFGKPRLGTARIEMNEILTTDWLETNRRKIRRQIDNVVSCGGRRGYGTTLSVGYNNSA